MSVFELLREALTPEQVLGVARNSKSKCVAPEHEDNHPSMHVYDDHVHCFSCGFHGDVVNIWSAQHGFDRQIEAAAELAQAFRIELPEMSPEAQQNLQERREKEESYFTQAELCHNLLEKRLHIREWWESRGFSREHQERFLLGASEDGRAATIPFWHRGRVQGLIHRKLEGEPKYVYPKVQDFPRGHRPLFIPGPVRARTYLVEGILDALAVAVLEQSAVAIGSTTISPNQIEELQQLPGPLYILPDADPAGDKAGREWVRDLYPNALLCPAGYDGVAVDEQ